MHNRINHNTQAYNTQNSYSMNYNNNNNDMNQRQQRSGQSPQDYLKFSNVSPEMLQFGMNTGADILAKQKERFMPGVSGFWLSLKVYFSVSNKYVLKKLSILLYPISHKNWSRVYADEQYGSEVLSLFP